MSTLYAVKVHLWLMLGSNLMNITYFMPSRFIYFTLTTLKLLSCSSGSPTWRTSSWPTLCIIYLLHWSCCCHHVDFHTTLKWFWFMYPPHFFPYAGHCWGYPVLQYLQLSSLLYTLSALWTYFSICCLMKSKSFTSFIPLKADFAPFAILLCFPI